MKLVPGIFLALIMAFLIPACEKTGDANNPEKKSSQSGSDPMAAIEKMGSPPSAPAEPVKREYDPEQLKRGEELYMDNCSLCHGEKAEGEGDWKIKKEDGTWPAPPLNGTGHAWHHAEYILRDYILEGSVGKGGAMTGFKDTMNDDDVTDVIIWFQSKWPDKEYGMWLKRDEAGRKRQGKR